MEITFKGTREEVDSQIATFSRGLDDEVPFSESLEKQLDIELARVGRLDRIAKQDNDEYRRVHQAQRERIAKLEASIQRDDTAGREMSKVLVGVRRELAEEKLRVDHLTKRVVELLAEGQDHKRRRDEARALAEEWRGHARGSAIACNAFCWEPKPQRPESWGLRLDRMLKAIPSVRCVSMTNRDGVVTIKTACHIDDTTEVRKLVEEHVPDNLGWSLEFTS